MEIIQLEAMNSEEMREMKEIERDGSEQHEKEGEDSRAIQPWTKQITLRGLIASILIGSIFSVIAMKLVLTTGVIPNLNLSAAFIGFMLIRTWTKLLSKVGLAAVQFSQQENTMIQTCAVACYSIVVGGGFGSYIFGLDKKIYEQTGVDTPGNSPGSYKEFEIGWLIGFHFVVSFIGLFILIPLRKILIVDYKLTFPTGMATAVLVNGLHTFENKTSKKQLRGFLKFFSFSFLWAFFQWFYTGKGQCGFMQFPTFGLQAMRQTFYFDFSMTNVGTAMLCPHTVNLSMLAGSVLSWGIMWPLIHLMKGIWFPADLPESSMRSLNGYKVFISIALLLGDGLYNFIKILYFAFIKNTCRVEKKGIKSALSISAVVSQNKALWDKKQDEVFNRETIPMWVGAAGYVLFAIICAIVIPFIFSEVKWYYVIIACFFAPSLAFCNAYGAGLTDINMAYNYSKIGLFVFAALGGRQNGVVAGLAGCGLIKSAVSVSCTLMQDFKTGHYTLTSPRSMFLNQVIGTAIGCVVGPLSFFLFYRAFDVGNPNGVYRAPYATIYRDMAILGVEGFSALPQHCLQLCAGFFAFAIAVSLVKDLSPPRIGRWMPLPMVMAIPFLVGAYLAVDMVVGSLVVFVCHKLNSERAKMMVPAIASGLICGEGLWVIPASVLALATVTPPMCMTFLSS